MITPKTCGECMYFDRESNLGEHETYGVLKNCIRWGTIITPYHVYETMNACKHIEEEQKLGILRIINPLATNNKLVENRCPWCGGVVSE